MMSTHYSYVNMLGEDSFCFVDVHIYLYNNNKYL